MGSVRSDIQQQVDPFTREALQHSDAPDYVIADLLDSPDISEVQRRIAEHRARTPGLTPAQAAQYADEVIEKRATAGGEARGGASTPTQRPEESPSFVAVADGSFPAPVPGEAEDVPSTVQHDSRLVRAEVVVTRWRDGVTSAPEAITALRAILRDSTHLQGATMSEDLEHKVVGRARSERDD